MLNSIPPKIDVIARSLVSVQRVVLFILSLMMAGIFFLVVILRYVLETDLFAYEEWTLMAAFWLYFLGGAQGSYENSHIKADFIQVLVTGLKARWVFHNIALMIELLIGIVLCYWGYLMMAEELAIYPEWQRTAVWKLPLAVPRFAIFLGFILMSFYTFLHLWNSLREGPSEIWESDEEERVSGLREGDL